MPTYDYVCGACGHALELFHSMSEAPRRKCPACGKQKLERRIGKGAGILFKGTGFYQTDYRSDSYKKGAESGAEKSDGDKGASEKSTSESTTSKDASGENPAAKSPASPPPAKKRAKPS